MKKVLKGNLKRWIAFLLAVVLVVTTCVYSSDAHLRATEGDPEPLETETETVSETNAIVAENISEEVSEPGDAGTDDSEQQDPVTTDDGAGTDESNSSGEAQTPDAAPTEGDGGATTPEPEAVDAATASPEAEASPEATESTEPSASPSASPSATPVPSEKPAEENECKVIFTYDEAKGKVVVKEPAGFSGKEDTVEKESVVKFTVEPEDGYLVKEVKVEGETDPVEPDSDEVYTLDINAETKVKVTFEEEVKKTDENSETAKTSYKVTISAEENGTVTVNTSEGEEAEVSGTYRETVEEGASMSFTVEPEDGYTSSVTIDGEAVSETSVYELKEISADTEVKVTFTADEKEEEDDSQEADEYKLTVNVSGEGTVTVNTSEGEADASNGYSETVEKGSSVSLDVKADEGYTGTVTVNGESVAAASEDENVSTYEINDINADTVVDVEFAAEEAEEYEVILNVPEANGTVKVNTSEGGATDVAGSYSETVKEGDTFSFSVEPERLFTSVVTVNGKTVSATSKTLNVSTYVVTVEGETEIEVAFAEEADKDAMPGQELTAEAGGVTVTVNAEPGVLPKDTTIKAEVVPVDEVRDVLDAVVEDGKEIKDIIAIDVTLYDKDGIETVQPAPGKEVSVRFSNISVSGEAESMAVYYVNDDRTLAEDVTKDRIVSESIVFSRDHFSTFPVVAKGSSDNGISPLADVNAYTIKVGEALTLGTTGGREHQWKFDEVYVNCSEITNDKQKTGQAVIAGKAITQNPITVTHTWKTGKGAQTITETFKITVVAGQSIPEGNTRIYVYAKVTGDTSGLTLNKDGWYTIGYIDVPSSVIPKADNSNDVTEIGANGVSYYKGDIKSIISEYSSLIDRHSINSAIDFDLKSMNFKYPYGLHHSGGASDYDVSGTQWHLDGEFNIDSSKGYILNVEYKYHDGEEGDIQLKDSYREDKKALESYEIIIPPVNGYVATIDGKVVSESYSGVMGNSDVTKIVIYHKDTNGNKIPDCQETSYTVSYDANADVYSGNVPLDEKVLEGTETNVSSERLTRTGYKFEGWETKDVDVTNGKFTMPGNDVKFTATWTKDSYTITYAGLEGATVEGSNPTSYAVDTPDFTLNNPTKEGYTFAGWTGTELEGATLEVTVEEGSTGNRSYTATWTANIYAYSVEYYYDDQIDADATEREEAAYNNVVREYTKKLRDEYALDKVEGLPLTVSEIEGNNVIKVYYARDVINKDNPNEQGSDGIPDKYQAKVVFVINNGTWVVGDGERDNATHTSVVSWKKLENDELVDTTFEFNILVPHDMQGNSGYTDDAGWNKVPTATGLERGKTNVFTYSYAKGKFGYTVKYVDDENKELKTKIGEAQEFMSVVEEDAIVIEGYALDDKAHKELTIEADEKTNVIIFQYSLDKISDPAKDLDDNPDNGDGIPDKYQAVVTYSVVGGTWSDNSNKSQEHVITLAEKAADGTWTAIENPDRHIPTGMIGNESYSIAKGWYLGENTDVEVNPADIAIVGGEEYTFTYIYARGYMLTINYLDNDGNVIQQRNEQSYEEGTNLVLSVPDRIMIDNDHHYQWYETEVTPGEALTVTLGIALDGTMPAGDVVITARYSLDEVDENDPYNSGQDGIPDIYQAKVTYKIEHGTWDDSGDIADKVNVFTLRRKDTNGEWSTVTPAPTLGTTVPDGMKPDTGYRNGKWSDITPTSDYVVTGDTTFTVSWSNVYTLNVLYRLSDGTVLSRLPERLFIYGEEGVTVYVPEMPGYTCDWQTGVFGVDTKLGDLDYTITYSLIPEATPTPGEGGPTPDPDEPGVPPAPTATPTPPAVPGGEEPPVPVTPPTVAAGPAPVAFEEALVAIEDADVPLDGIITQDEDGNPIVVPVDEVEVPLDDKELDDHKCCIMSFLLMLATLIIYSWFTHSMKKRQKKLAELKDQLAEETLKRQLGIADESSRR